MALLQVGLAILPGAWLIGCEATRPTALMSCEQIAKAKEFSHVHFHARVSLTFLMDCGSRSSDSHMYCYVPVSCGTDELLVLLRRGDDRNNVYIPFNEKSDRKTTDPAFDLKGMEIRTRDGKSATVGESIDVEGDLKKGKGLKEFSYIDNADIRSVASTASPRAN